MQKRTLLDGHRFDQLHGDAAALAELPAPPAGAAAWPETVVAVNVAYIAATSAALRIVCAARSSTCPFDEETVAL